MWLKKYITILHRTCINWVKIIQCISYQYRPLYELKILDKKIMEKISYLSITMQRLRHFSIILQLPPRQASHSADHRHYLGRILYTDQPNIIPHFRTYFAIFGSLPEEFIFLLLQELLQVSQTYSSVSRPIQNTCPQYLCCGKAATPHPLSRGDDILKPACQ